MGFLLDVTAKDFMQHETSNHIPIPPFGGELGGNDPLGLRKPLSSNMQQSLGIQTRLKVLQRPLTQFGQLTNFRLLGRS